MNVTFFCQEKLKNKYSRTWIYIFSFYSLKNALRKYNILGCSKHVRGLSQRD